MELLVAASALDTDSVDGHRSRPSGVTRLDLLNVVGSRPERLASPEGDSPARSASRSSAVQIWSWVSMRGAFGGLAMGSLVQKLGIITSIDRLPQCGASDWQATDKRPNAALEVRRCRRYGRSQVRNFQGNPEEKLEGIPRDSNDQAGLRARAHDLQNLFRFGLARGRAARRVPRQRRRCPRRLHSFFSPLAGGGNGPETFLRPDRAVPDRGRRRRAGRRAAVGAVAQRRAV